MNIVYTKIEVLIKYAEDKILNENIVLAEKLLRHNELGLAYDTICGALMEKKIAIPNGFVSYDGWFRRKKME